MSLTNPTFDELAQVAHASVTCNLVIVAAHWGTKPMLAVAGAIIVFALWKEFWFDMHEERLDVSGGWNGGVQDFAFYALGTALGLLLGWGLR